MSLTSIGLDDAATRTRLRASRRLRLGYRWMKQRKQRQAQKCGIDCVSPQSLVPSGRKPPSGTRTNTLGRSVNATDRSGSWVVPVDVGRK